MTSLRIVAVETQLLDVINWIEEAKFTDIILIFSVNVKEWINIYRISPELNSFLHFYNFCYGKIQKTLKLVGSHFNGFLFLSLSLWLISFTSYSQKQNFLQIQGESKLLHQIIRISKEIILDAQLNHNIITIAIVPILPPKPIYH